uniref:THAP-type domain-containing protein n=1 Tax=Mola mola TaxID=94237 RepID=A0A3Q4BFB2_MOLML
MPHSCSASGCKHRCTVETRARRISFHKFPKDKVLRKQWEVSLRRKGFTASQSSRLCSEHFREEDFDRTGQTIRLRDGAVPSLFSFSPHPQKVCPDKSNRMIRRASLARLDGIIYFHPCFREDHSYALPTSPADLKSKLWDALARVESLEREMGNAKDRERRAKNAVCGLLEDPKVKSIINKELKKRLESYSDKMKINRTYLNSVQHC